MSRDRHILQDLFLPMLEELATRSPELADALVSGNAFWIQFNEAILDTGNMLSELLAQYKVADAAIDLAKFNGLKAEYIAAMAHYYCLGEGNDSIEKLQEQADAHFIEEVAFQKDLAAAALQMGRTALKDELKQASEFADVDIPDNEIAAAFSSIHTNSSRQALRQQMREWGRQDPVQPESGKRKRRLTIPLMFLRFAAAAATITVATVGLMKVYNNKNHVSQPSADVQLATDTIAVRQVAPAADTAKGGDTRLSASPIPAPLPPATVRNKKPETTTPDIVRIDSPAKAPVSNAPPAAHLPHIVLKGTIIDVTADKLLTDVTVTMIDDKGNKQTIFSKTGKFQFDLPLHRDFIITGQKENYISDRVPLSTKKVKDTAPDDVVEGTLQLSRSY
jgi:hypothetical protein